MNNTKFAVTSAYNGCTITCSTSQWDEHIIIHHPIMNNNLKAVKDTVKDPDGVYKSEEFENRDVYFKQSSCSSYKLLTKVIVENTLSKNNNPIGEVVTAFPAKIEKGGIGSVLYRRTEN